MSRARLATTLLYLGLWPTLLVLVAGDWRWLGGWLFGAWFVAMSAHVLVWLYLYDPALLAERYRKPGTGGQSQHDRRLVYVLFGTWVVWFVVMPLDHRFGWSPALPIAAVVAGLVVLMISWFFLFRACKDNSYASTLVRIQRERGQKLVSTGVYAIVRHPMYLGGTLLFVAAPLVTGALTAYVPGLLLVAIVVARIGDEEALLVKELEGYEDYRRRVRWRLVPYLW